MADKFTPGKRSEIMSRIGGKNTSPEISVRRLLHRMGYRFRIHHAGLPGKPDIVLPRYKVVVLVHGCFWHGHPDCRRATIPETQPDFWRAKIARNRARDSKVRKQLSELGYQTVVVWQCELKEENKVATKLSRELTRAGKTHGKTVPNRSA